VICMRLGRRVPLHGGGAAVKSYIHVRDVSRGELAILERGRIGTLYHLSPPAGLAVREVVRRIAVRLGRAWDEAVTLVGERPGQDAAYVIDSARAREQLGWQPQIDFDTGIDEVVRWVEEYWEAIQTESLEYQHKP
jgi:dTDP-glucose 4,6-dehydratase